MKVRYLLDEHISPVAARSLAASGVDAVRVSEAGLSGQDDRRILEAAIAENRILVTCDLGDFLPLIQEFIQAGRTIPGVVLADAGAWPTDRPERLASALRALARQIESGRKSAAYGLFLNPPPQNG